MENALIFASEKEVQFTKLLKFIVPTYLTSLFNTVYTIIDGIFVSTYVGTNALASINTVYPIVNVLPELHLYLLPAAALSQLCNWRKQKKGSRPLLFCQFFCSYFAWMPRFPDDSYESLSNSDHARCNPRDNCRV